MQRRAFFSAAAGLVALAGSAIVSDSANADQQPRVAACFSQLDGNDTKGVVSQNFEKTHDTWDALGADDFALRGQCQVSKVSVEGSYLNYAESPSSLHVTFYRSSAGQVGEVLSSQDGLSYDEPVNSGDFVVNLAHPLKLAPGRYWVSVQANMSFTTQGEWFWSTNEVQRGNKAKWANPKGGWGTFCTTWKDLAKCVGSDADPDFTFALLK